VVEPLGHEAVNKIALRLFVAVTLAATAVAPLPGQAKWSLSRTPWGDPDFGGVWNYATMTPFERPREWAEKDLLTPEEAAAFEQQTIGRRANTNNTAGPDWWDPGTNVMKDRRSSLVVDPPDGRIPPLTPDAQKRAAGRGRGGRGGPEAPEQLGLNERCLSWATAGPPMVPGVYNNNVQFVQTRADIVIFNEMIHEARIVPMDGRPHGTIRRWMGDSRGRWEGQTLVVDTINFGSQVNYRGSSQNLHLVERFTRTGDRTLDYRFTVEDATVWTRPWTVDVPMTRIDAQIYEYACHEGNFRSVVGMLNGTLAQDKFKERP
jgi:hypothetical protein